MDAFDQRFFVRRPIEPRSPRFLGLAEWGSIKFLNKTQKIWIRGLPGLVLTFGFAGLAQAQLTFDPNNPPSSPTPPTEQYFAYTGSYSHQKGPKTVMVFLVQPSDGGTWTNPKSFATLDGELNAASQNYYDASYHQTWFGPKKQSNLDIPRLVVTPVLILPKTKSQYLANFGLLQSDCVAAARALGGDWNGGYKDPDYYDRWVVMSNTKMISSTGLAFVGGKFAWTGGALSGGVAVHELGHNWGVFHANSWDVPAGAHPRSSLGSSGEYNDGWDIMGGNSTTAMFNPQFRENLGFLERSRGEVLDLTTSGTYRIWDYIHPDRRRETSKVRALNIPMSSHTDPKRVILGFGHTTNNDERSKWNRNAVTVHSKLSDGSNRIDTTPGSRDDNDAHDSSIKIGRTYSEGPEVNGTQMYGGFHVTPVARGSEVIEGQIHEWIDVVVNFQNSISGNLPPTSPVVTSPNPTVMVGGTVAYQTAVNVPITLTASASDPNGDTLAWDWHFGHQGSDAVNFVNSATQSPVFSSPGLYRVNVTATDMKGGTSTGSAWVNVGSQPIYDPTVVASLGSINYRYYEGNFTSMPNFGNLFPIKEGVVENFSLSPRNRNDQFAMVFEGLIDVPADDIYTFHLRVDDGALFYIDNVLVVESNSNKSSAQRSYGSIQLKAGLHPFRLEYFHKDGAEVLEVAWSTLTMSQGAIPSANLKRVDPSAMILPQVEILTPDDNESFLVSSSVVLTANASHPDGIDRVQYFYQGALLGQSTDSTTNYEVIWPNVSVGAKTVVAVAYDIHGKFAKSVPVSFVVNAPEPRNSLGLNFGADKGSLQAGEATGAIYTNNNWNNYSGASGTDAPVFDQTRSVTSARVSWEASGAGSGSFSSLAEGDTASGRLMLGGIWLRSDVEPEPHYNPHAVISNIPYMEYDVYVYFDQKRTNSEDITTQRFVLTDYLGQTRQIFGKNSLSTADDLGDYPNYDTWIGFREAKGTSLNDTEANLLGNYVVFRGVTGSSFKVESARNNGLLPPDTTGRHGRFFNAIQIVEAPPTVPRVHIVPPSDNSLAEGGVSKAYSLRLTLPPTSNVTVQIQADAQLVTSPATVVFTPSNWDQLQTVSVSAVNDSLVEGLHSATITHTVDGSDNYAAVTSADPVEFSITDNDKPGVFVTSIGSLREGQSGTATFLFSRVETSSISSPVTVSFEMSGTALTSGDYSLSGASVTYDSATGLGQVVIPAGQSQVALTVSVVNDSQLEFSEQATLTVLSNAQSEPAEPASASISILDDDATDYYTQVFHDLFRGNQAFDLNNRSVLFTPSGSGSYSVTVDPISAFPSGTSGFTTFSKTAMTSGTASSGWWEHNLVAPFTLFGQSYNKIFVSTEGVITFIAGTSRLGSIWNHFSTDTSLPGPRISAYWSDLDPNAGGNVRYRRIDSGTESRTVIFYDAVRLYNSSTKVSCQVELFDDGRIRLSYLSSNPTSSAIAVVGIATGVAETMPSSNYTPTATPRPFYYSDFSNYPSSNSANRAPFFSSVPVLSGQVGQIYFYEIFGGDGDPGEALQYSAVSKPSWLTLVDHGNRTATLSGTPPASGSYDITLQVSDGTSTAQQTFTLLVVPAGGNTPPSFTSTPPTLISQGDLFSYTVTASDVDGHRLTFAGVAMPSWLTLTDHGNGTATLSGQVPPFAVSSQVVLQVSDGMAATSQSFQFTVNHPPSVWIDRPASFAVAQAVAGVPLAVHGGYDDDEVGGGTATIQWQTISGPAAAVFDDASALQTTVSFPVAGTYVIALNVHDGLVSAAERRTVVVGGDPSAILANGLLGYWRFEDGSGSTAVDSSGNGKDATTTGITWTSGYSGGGIASNGSDKNNATALIPEPAASTVSAWVKAATLPATSDRMLWTFLDSSNNTRYRAYIPSGSRKLRVLHDRGTDGVWECDYELNGNEWVHVAVAYDRSSSSNVPSIYINGVPQNVTTITSPSGSMSLGNTSFRMVRSWSGAVDEFRVYDRVLSAEEIGLLMVAGPINHAPQVTAGEDASAIVAIPFDLQGQVTDDALPEVPGNVTIRWEVVSGPGVVDFVDANAADTQVTFNTSGTYVLRLTADDGELLTFDDVVIVVDGPPAAPAGLTATAISSSQIQLGWADQSDNEITFTVERRVGAGDFVEIASLSPGTTSYSDSGLASGTTYTYRIRAVNGAGSSLSNEASATTPSGAGGMTFASWMSSQSGTNGQNGPLDNPTGDGVKNLMKYALQIPAGQPADPSKLPVVTVDENQHLSISFRRMVGGSGSPVSGYTVNGITYTVQLSNDLSAGSWQSGESLLEMVGTPVDNGDGTETVTVRAIVPGGPRQFIRLRVDQVP